MALSPWKRNVVEERIFWDAWATDTWRPNESRGGLDVSSNGGRERTGCKKAISRERRGGSRSEVPLPEVGDGETMDGTTVKPGGAPESTTSFSEPPGGSLGVEF